MNQQIYELEETRKQLSHTLPALSENIPRKQIIEIASRYSSFEMFEKDGCYWIGWIGFKFDDSGKLKSVSPSWNFGEQDPCYPIDNY